QVEFGKTALADHAHGGIGPQRDVTTLQGIGLPRDRPADEGFCLRGEAIQQAGKRRQGSFTPLLSTQTGKIPSINGADHLLCLLRVLPVGFSRQTGKSKDSSTKKT